MAYRAIILRARCDIQEEVFAGATFLGAGDGLKGHRRAPVRLGPLVLNGPAACKEVSGRGGTRASAEGPGEGDRQAAAAAVGPAEDWASPGSCSEIFKL